MAVGERTIVREGTPNLRVSCLGFGERRPLHDTGCAGGTGGSCMTLGSRRGLRSWLPVAAVLIALSGCSTIGAPARPTTPSGAIEVDVIGDSLSTGAMTLGDPWTADAQRVLQTAGREVQFVNAAENGAGYLARGENGDTFIGEVDRVVSRRAQIVVLFGSDNDLGLPNLEPAVEAALHCVRELAPRATVIVIGPPAPPAQRAQQLEGIRDQLQTATGQVRARFVDPLALDWFQRASSADVGPDAEHPNTAGERYLADQMVAILKPTIDRMSAAGRGPAGVTAAGAGEIRRCARIS